MDIKQATYPEPRQISSSSPPSSSLPPTKALLGIDVLQSLRVHALAATLVALLTLGLGIALLIRHGVTYAATSVVYVSPTFPATLAPDRETEFPAYESYIDEQTRAVTRYGVLAEALHKLGQGAWQEPGESEQAAVQRLQRALSVEREGASYQMDIKLTGRRPVHLANVVNTITNVYLEKTKDNEYYGLGERLATLKQARDQVQKDLDAALQQRETISRRLGVAVIGGGGDDSADQLDSQVAKVRSDLTDAHEKRIEAAAQLSSLENGKPNTPNPALDAAAEEIITSDSGLTSLKTSLSTRRAALMEQLAGLTPSNPLRKQTEAELADTQAGLQKLQDSLRAKAAQQLTQKLRTQLNRATTIESKLRAELQASTGKAVSAAPAFQQADQLKAQIATLQARYATLDQRTHNLELENDSPGAVRMFSPARTPLRPEKSKTRYLAILLLPFALTMGVGSAVALDLFDPRVYSPSDIEQVLGFAPIGAIFDESDVTLHAYDECALRLAAGVDQAARTAGVRTVVLTGVHSGVGTTSVVEDLGSTLAKLGRKTLTIDASGVTPPVAYLTIGFNRGPQKAENGPSRGGQESQHTVAQTSVVTQPFNPPLTPLTSFMDQAFKDLTSEYDLVLIDATPLLISAETEYLARFADVTIVVAESGKTRKARLRRASRLLERLNVRGIAAVINKVSLQRASQATREDLEDFEAHVNQMNLRWRPSVQAQKAPDSESGEPADAKQNHTYA